MTRSDIFDVTAVYPNGRVCRWLKEDLDTGAVVNPEVRIQGTCRLFGGIVYDLSCKDCSRYERW